MNHRKHKQSENLRRLKKEKYSSYENDPEDASCPYCGQKGKPCSHVNSLSRAYARGACKKKNQN